MILLASDPDQQFRAYFFGNNYISPIQHGIQAAHVVTRFFVKYHNDDNITESEVLYEWAENHMTKILLNGGYQSNLAKIYKIFEKVGPIIGLPFTQFREEQDSLNGALTSVGIVVPMGLLETAASNIGRQQLFEGASIDQLLGYLDNNRKLQKIDAILILAATLKTGKLA